MPSTFQNIGQSYVRIIAPAVAKLIKNPAPFSRTIIIDCRSDIEYNAGHIRNAINVNSEDGMAKLVQGYEPEAVYIFHCEWSQVRGPTACSNFLKSIKETTGKDPNAYVLDQGYRAFHKSQSSYCVGQYEPEHH